MAEQSAVVANETKNKYLAIYFAGLTAVGLALLGLTIWLEWGFMGYFGAGFFLLAGVGSLLSQRKWGGAGKASCPRCQASFDVMNIGIARTTICPACHTWLHGAREMAPVEFGHLAKLPEFEAPLPEQFAWPDGCPVCGEPATRKVKVEGANPLGLVAAAVAPVGIYRVSRVDAPACASHKDGVGLTRWPHATMISFRSFDYWMAFCELNQIPAERVSEAYWKRHEKARDASG